VWEHSAFEEGTAVARWLVNIAGLAIYPLAIAALALTPSRPPYMPERQGRAAPRYES
jgi:hypothetical protein